MTNRLDVIIFGASGLTGKLAVYEAVKILSKNTWGIAGRNETKLKDVLNEVAEKTGQPDLSTKIPIIIADVNDDDSLQKMAKQAKVIVNCCGPFALYGEAVIKACINSGTHHVDVSAEPQFTERMQLEYNDLAKANGVFIINSCGIGFLPLELGAIFLERHFDGLVNSIETYYYVNIKDYKYGETIMNLATLESFIHSQVAEQETIEMHAKLFPEKLPEIKPELPKRSCIHKSPENKWSIPLMSSGRLTIERSQRLQWDERKKRPIEHNVYLSFSSILNVFLMLLLSIIGRFIALFSCGRKLLLNNPNLFFLGFFSKGGPNTETRQNTTLTLTLHGKGWPSDKIPLEAIDEKAINTTETTKTLVIKVKIQDPAYRSSAITILISALTILNEHPKLAGRGGVMTPGAAFEKTAIIDKLIENGLKFEIVSGIEEMPEEIVDEIKEKEVETKEKDETNEKVETKETRETGETSHVEEIVKKDQ